MLHDDRNGIRFLIQYGKKLFVRNLFHSAVGKLFVLPEQREGILNVRRGELQSHASSLFPGLMAVVHMLPTPTSAVSAATLSSSRYCSMTCSSVPWAERMKSMASRPAPWPPGFGVM